MLSAGRLVSCCLQVHFAAGAGALGMLGRFLALAPQAVDMSDTIGWTPLFWACNNGHGAWHMRQHCGQLACLVSLLCIQLRWQVDGLPEKTHPA